MNKIEYRIIAKIIKQLSLFMMLHGVKDFKLEYHLSNEKVEFILNVDHIKDELLERMKDKIGKHREIEVETYGWELMGDTDAQTELDILGLLIDSIDIKKNNDQYQITLTRLHKTKIGS